MKIDRPITMDWTGKTYRYASLDELLAHIELSRRFIKHEWSSVAGSEMRDDLLADLAKESLFLSEMIGLAVRLVEEQENQVHTAISEIDRLVGEL